MMQTTSKRARLFERRDEHRRRMIPNAARAISKRLVAEYHTLRDGGSVDVEAWFQTMRQIRYGVAEEIWAYTVDEIYDQFKLDPDMLRRLANNPGALRAVAVGARNAAERQAEISLQALDLITADQDFLEVLRALYNKDARASRSQIAARQAVLDAAAEFQHAAAEATQEPLRKEWLSVQDSRVRETHAVADAQYQRGSDPGPIPIDQAFIVGGEYLIRPRDPAGSPKETFNCRCQEFFVPAIPG